MTFLSSVDLRPLPLPEVFGFASIGLALGKGPHALEVAIVECPQRPTVVTLRRTWNARLGGRAVPLLLVALYGDKAALCGPAGQQPPVYVDADPSQAERICLAALDEPDRHAALRFLQAALPEVEGPLPGLRNEGLLATHELLNGVPRRADWLRAGEQAHPALTRRGRALLQALGFEIITMDGPLYALAARGTKVALALFLDQGEALDLGSSRFYGSTPIAYALARADHERLPYVVVTVGSRIRLHPVSPDTGVSRRGRTETFVELHLDLLPAPHAAYLWLLFSADALLPDGSLEQILSSSTDYAADLGIRLRERIYKGVVPCLAMAIAGARGRPATVEELATVYEMALTLLFRLLFVAYAEDQGLLPYRTNDLYRARSLKFKARELRQLAAQDVSFGQDTSQWDEIHRLFAAVDHGKPEWGIPTYNGGLFSANPAESPVGAALEDLALRDDAFGPALAALLLEDSPEGPGPVDFRSLGVREFGTIYEGLLESELSVAQVDLALDADDNYVPARSSGPVVVHAGEIYLHSASGARKLTGSYYTKPFAVEHLLDYALEPALDEHIARLTALDERRAGESFFDFRVADIAMGSGHFLVAAVDRIERRLSAYLAQRPLPTVQDELLRLRQRAAQEIEQLGGHLQVDDNQLLRRQIARRCIYGVDLNATAVALARLSLWVHTFVPGLPLSLLDQNLLPGNSLVGIATLDEAVDILGSGEGSFLTPFARTLLDGAKESLAHLGRLADADAAEIADARQSHAAAREALRSAEALFDILAASRLDARLNGLIGGGEVTHWVREMESLPGSAVHREAQQALAAIPPFHFPIAFPQVFLRDRPGFDVILGNPPWEEATVEEDRFWLRYEPRLQGLPQYEQETHKEILRSERPDLVKKHQEEVETAALLRRVLVVGPFPGMGTGDPDLYKAFTWRFWNLVARPSGRIGVVLPRSAFAAKGSAEFRRAVLRSGTFVDLTFLLNSGGWVFDDAEPRYTIGLATLQKTAPGPASTLLLRGPFRSLERFLAGRQQEPVRFPIEEIFTWTDTAALPLLPAEESAGVFAQLRKAPRLDLDDGRSWRARPYAELHATNDKPLMHIAKECPPGYWPVFKGESFDLWQPDTGTYYAWADPRTLLPHLQEKRLHAAGNRKSPFSEFDRAGLRDERTLPCLHPRIAFRDVTRATDSRTLRVALIPGEIFITNKGPYLLWPRGDHKDAAYLLGVLNSLPLDWYARRFVEINMNFHILNPFPVPRPARSDPLWQRTVALAGRLACPDERFAAWARAVGVAVGPLDAEIKADMIAELDAGVAHLYGLSERQLNHVFETFHEGWDYEERLQATLAHYRHWEQQR